MPSDGQVHVRGSARWARVVVAAALSALCGLVLAPAGARAAAALEASFEVKGATQPASHPSEAAVGFTLPAGVAEAHGTPLSVRFDLPTGFVIDPQQLARCAASSFEAAVPQCASGSEAGAAQLTVPGRGPHLPRQVLSGRVYDLEQPAGMPLELGIYVPEEHEYAPQHLLLEGHISWTSDYHEYLELASIPASLPLLGARIALGEGVSTPALLTLPSSCPGPLWASVSATFPGDFSESAEAQGGHVSGCEHAPFAPTATLVPETAGSEQPDGAALVIQPPSGGELEEADLASARALLPQGLALDLSAGRSLGFCTAAQFAAGEARASECPAGSGIGSVTIDTPLLPEALSGGVYAGPPGALSAAGAELPIYIDAEGRYGLAVRLPAVLSASAAQPGQLTLSFAGAPQIPLGRIEVRFNGGAGALLANPLACGAAPGEALLGPFTGAAAAVTSALSLTTTGCASPLAFTPSQSASDGSDQAGAATTFSLALGRGAPGQSLAHVRTVLPSGLLPRFPGIALCSEAQLAQSACPQQSELGSVFAEAGAGSAPLPLSGRAFLTGPYEGAPFGVGIAIPVALGPYPLGALVIHAKLDIEGSGAHVILEASLPGSIAGVPLRLRRLNLAIERAGFLANPTACGEYHTRSSVTGSAGAAPHSLSTKISIGACSSLGFAPALSAFTSEISSARIGAELFANLSVPAGDSNVRSLLVQLPRAFEMRASTYAQACAEPTFDADPEACPAGSLVGGAHARTPLLESELSGPVILVSHAETRLPELHLMLAAEGVRIPLVGSVRYFNHITFISFSGDPDAPLSSLALELATGPHSALALVPHASLCTAPLQMPTTITAWNTKSVKQVTSIAQHGCGVRILSSRVHGDVAYLTVQTFAAGRLSGSGRGLKTVFVRLASARRAFTLKVPLLARLRHHRGALSVRVLVGFRPSSHGMPVSAAFATVRFP